MLTNLMMGLIGLIFLAAFAYEVGRGRRGLSLWGRVTALHREFVDAFVEGYRGGPAPQSPSRGSG